MRFMRLAVNYPSYLLKFYGQKAELKQESYSVQYRTLMGDCFGRADFLTHALGNLGYEVWEPVCNAEPMQKAWARENGARYGERTWLTDILMAQVTLFRPEIIFAGKHAALTGDFFCRLRRQCKSIQLIFGWIDSPYANEEVIKAWDLIISNIPSLVEHFRGDGLRCEYMTYAFDPRVLDKIDRGVTQTIPFSFIGSIVKGPGFHNEREQLLKKLIEETPLQIWSDVSQPSLQELRLLPWRRRLHQLARSVKPIPGATSFLATIPVLKNYMTMERSPDLSHHVDGEIVGRSHPALYGLAMYQKLYESKVTFNNHIDLSARFANNMRLFEATGVGTCLLTDWKPNLCELFEPDLEVVTYQSAEEAVEKVRYLLGHDEERQKIATAGQCRTLQNYTYDHRAQELDRLIRKSIKS